VNPAGLQSSYAATEITDPQVIALMQAHDQHEKPSDAADDICPEAAKDDHPDTEE
jgi:hypothetical protein